MGTTTDFQTLASSARAVPGTTSKCFVHLPVPISTLPLWVPFLALQAIPFCRIAHVPPSWNTSLWVGGARFPFSWASQSDHCKVATCPHSRAHHSAVFHLLQTWINFKLHKRQVQALFGSCHDPPIFSKGTCWLPVSFLKFLASSVPCSKMSHGWIVSKICSHKSPDSCYYNKISWAMWFE